MKLPSDGPTKKGIQQRSKILPSSRNR